MIYAIVIGIVVFYVIYFFVSVANSNKKLFKLYEKYLKIDNKKKMLGKEIAFLGMHDLELDVRIAMRGGTLTDAYSYKQKIVIISEEVCESSSIAASAIVAHELGHAVQHQNKSFLFGLVRFLKAFTKIFCGFALPCIIIGAVMWIAGFEVMIGKSILATGIVLIFIKLIKDLFEIPLESNASEIGFRFLVDNELIDKKHYKKVKKFMNVASKTYMKDFFKQFIPFAFK